MAMLAATDSEGVETDGLAAASFFRSFRGLSRESSTVASAGQERESEQTRYSHSVLHESMRIRHSCIRLFCIISNLHLQESYRYILYYCSETC